VLENEGKCIRNYTMAWMDRSADSTRCSSCLLLRPAPSAPIRRVSAHLFWTDCMSAFKLGLNYAPQASTATTRSCGCQQSRAARGLLRDGCQRDQRFTHRLSLARTWRSSRPPWTRRLSLGSRRRTFSRSPRSHLSRTLLPGSRQIY
jgi:hypothetical protein